MRTAHVRRWHIVRTLREQTLAEHSFLVTMLARELCVRLKFSLEDHGLATELALNHDMAEVVIGDIPTPTRRALKSWTETISGRNPLDLIEQLAIPGLVELPYPDHVRAVVKCADYIETCLFIAVEGCGGHAREVTRYVHDLFRSYLNSLIDESDTVESLRIPWEKSWGLYEELKGATI